MTAMDLTAGKPIRQLFLFSLPLILAFLGFTGVCIANPMAWGCGLVYCAFMLRRVLKKQQATP